MTLEERRKLSEKMKKDAEFYRACAKKGWQDPEKRKERISAIKKAMSKPEVQAKIQLRSQSPEYRAKLSRALKKKYKDPVFYAKHVAAAKKLAKDPRYIEKLRKAGKALTKNGVYMAKLRKAGKKLAADPVYIEKLRKASKALWEDPKWRTKTVRAIMLGLAPNTCELAVKNLLDLHYPGRFKFVGDGTKVINGFSPDFVDEKEKKIIEVFGDYWHSLPQSQLKDAKRIEEYERNGYSTLVIWECEIKKNPRRAVEKLEVFV